MSSRARKRSQVLYRAVSAKMEALETRVLLSTSAAAAVANGPSTSGLPNPPVPAPPLPTGQEPLQGIVGTPISLSPQMIQTLYGVNNIFFDDNGTVTAADGSGQTIAIVDAFGSPTIINDVQTFDAQWGLSNADSSGNFFLSVQALSPTVNTLPDTTSDILNWGEETSLDVEWAHVMAPRAHIDLIEAPSPGLLDMLDANVFAAGLSNVSVVSNSWGIDLTPANIAAVFSGNVDRFDGFLSTPTGHENNVFLFASGDDSTLSYPSASINVISVGGSTNDVDLDGSRSTIGAWSGSGGGPDTLYSPSHNVPLLSMDADPNTGVWVYDSQPGQVQGAPAPIISTPAGWSVVGGTSLACPLFAGVVATWQQGLTLTGQGTIGTTTLYDELLVAGESIPYYFDATVNPQPAFSTYPLWGMGPNIAIPSTTAIPSNRNTGFGDPILSNDTTDSNDQLTQGLTALIVGGNETVEEYGPNPNPPGLTFSTPFDYLEQNPSATIQHLGPNNVKGTPITNFYFAAPQTALVIDDSENTSVDELTFESEPQNATAGQAVQGIIVDVDFAGGGIDAGYNGAITLTLSDGGTIMGVDTVDAFDGRTVIPNTNTSAFSDVIIDEEVGNLVIEATGQNAIPAYSTPFNVEPAAAAKLVITAQPDSTLQYAVLAPIIIEVQDVFNNFDVNDFSVVSLAVASGPGGISGTARLNALGGIATFSNLSFTVPGTYILTASNTQDGLAPITTTSFTISAFPVQRIATFNGARFSTPILTVQQQRNAAIYTNDGFGGLPPESFSETSDAAVLQAASQNEHPAAVNNTASPDTSVLDDAANLRNDDAVSDLLQ